MEGLVVELEVDAESAVRDVARDRVGRAGAARAVPDEPPRVQRQRGIAVEKSCSGTLRDPQHVGERWGKLGDCCVKHGPWEVEHCSARVHDRFGGGVVGTAVEIKPRPPHHHRGDRHCVVRLHRDGCPHHRRVVEGTVRRRRHRARRAVLPHHKRRPRIPVAGCVNRHPLAVAVDHVAIRSPAPGERRGGEAELQREQILGLAVVDELGEVGSDPAAGNRWVRKPHNARERPREEIGLLSNDRKFLQHPQRKCSKSSYDWVGCHQFPSHCNSRPVGCERARGKPDESRLGGEVRARQNHDG
eukprot:m.391050 g.391050  ORF g.391050 m.391050 type:complete len:301 (-) comp16758_c2_seq2:460-1362(-)